jgi:hypothetical protein
MGVSVYTIANERFFPGLIGLVSSLRVNGHVGPIVVLDSGLTSAQVRTLSTATTMIQSPHDMSSFYLKPYGPLEHPDDVMLLIDADMLCVRPLDEIVERVRLGSIVAVEDIGRPGYSDAIWQQWQNRLQLGKLEPGVYANGGFFALPKELGTAFFTTFAQCLDRVDPSETHIDADGLDVELPFFWLDQDVANAVLASSPFREHTVILPYHCAPHAPFLGMKVAGNLSCVDDKGNRPVFLHHALQKPWLEPLPSNAYTELLVAYIHHPAAPAFDERELPLFLRSGRAAACARTMRAARGQVRARVRGKLGLRPYLAKNAKRMMQRGASSRAA